MLVPSNSHAPTQWEAAGGIWGWLQACLTASFCAPAQRHKHHADKHTPTRTHNTAHYNNTNIHITAHIITCDAHRPFLTETHMPAYMGGISMLVWLPSRFVPPTQVPDPSCVYRKQTLLMNSVRGQMPDFVVYEYYIKMYTQYVQFLKAVGLVNIKNCMWKIDIPTISITATLPFLFEETKCYKQLTHVTEKGRAVHAHIVIQ